MRVLLVLAGLLLCVYSAPLQHNAKLLSRAKRAAEQVIFGNHQNNARVKKSGPGLATPLRPLDDGAVAEDEADIDKKALVTSKVTSSEADQPQGQEDLTDDLEGDAQSHLEEQVQDAMVPSVDDASSNAQEASETAEVDDMKFDDSAASDASSSSEAAAASPALPEEVDAEQNMEPMGDEIPNNNVENMPSQHQPSFPLDIFNKNQLGAEYMDYPTYDYQYNPYLRRKRSLGQNKARAVNAEDMMAAGNVMASSGRRSKRDLGQDPRYAWEDYPEADYQEPVEEKRQEVLEEMLKDEMLKYNPELAEEMNNEIEEDEEGPYGPEQEAEDLALLNYLYRNGYADDDLEQEYEEEVEEAPEQPWEEMGPATQVALPEENGPYFYPYGQYASEDNVMSAPYGMTKRQYLSFVPGVRKRNSDFYPYAYGPDGRWGAMVAGEVMEKRAEEKMYERLMRLASALRDRRDELEAERYYDQFPEK